MSKEMEKRDILNNPSVKGLLELINDNINYLFQRKYGYKDFVITQGLTKLEYKTKNPQAHVAVYEKMTRRGIAVPVGTRIEYVVIDLMNGYDKKVKKFEKTEDKEYFNEFKEILRIDFLHYLESQAMKPLGELLSVCIHLEEYMENIFQDRINHNKMIYSLKKLFEPRINWVE
jgi:DNA polymerase elongation subunit (family B)